MGLSAAIKPLAYAMLAFISWLAAGFTRRAKLHSARFAHLHELANLVGSPAEDTHLLLGVTHLNQPLAVKPTKSRGELGNLLIVATLPTRLPSSALIYPERSISSQTRPVTGWRRLFSW